MLDKTQLKNGTVYICQKPLSDIINDGDFRQDFNLLLLSYKTFDTIDLEDEIDGTSEALTAVALESLNKSATVFCGITTQIMGLKHISVAVCHKGRLVDIVDRTSNLFNDDYIASEKIKIFSSDDINYAVLVDTDVLLEKNWAKVAPYSDVVFGIVKGNDERILDAAINLSKNYDVEVIVINDNSIRWKSK